MELPLGNFFQVTINSNKLYAFMEDIMRKIDIHQSRVTEFNQRLCAIGKSFDDKLALQQANLALEIQRVKKINQEQSNFIRLYLKDVDKKIGDRLIQTETNISQLSRKVNTTKEAIQEDISIKLSYLQKKIQNQTALEELEERVNQNFSKLTKNISNMSEDHLKKLEVVQQQYKKQTQINEGIIEKMNNNDFTNKIQHDHCTSIASSTRQVEGQLKSKRKGRGQRNDTFFQQLEGLSNNIQQKIDDLEYKLGQKVSQANGQARRSILSNSKIVKYHESVNKTAAKSGFGHKNQGKLKQIQKKLIERLGNIEQLCISRISILQKQMMRQGNRCEIIDQHIGILSRKLEKQKQKITQLAESLKITTDGRVDEKAIQALRTLLKKMCKDFEEALQQKVQRDIYEKQKQRIMEKIQPVYDGLNDKADKNQVRKGLAFLQQKLKEVIIVIAEDRYNPTDGAVRRTPFKCLSCDKDLEVDKYETVNGNCRLNKENNSSSMRNTTTQMRKRIRMINNTITTTNAED